MINLRKRYRERSRKTKNQFYSVVGQKNEVEAENFLFLLSSIFFI